MAEQQHTEERSRSYLYVFIALAIFTALEVGVSYLDELPHALQLGVLVVLAVSKIALVVLWFMHLRYDRWVFAVPFVLGLLLAVPMVLSIAISLRDEADGDASAQGNVSDNAAMSENTPAGSESAQSGNGGNDQTTQTTQTTSGASDAPSTLEVTQSDSGLELSTNTVGAGDVQIHVTNQSQDAKQLSIIRPGSSLGWMLPWHGSMEGRPFEMVQSGEEIPPSETTDMTVTMDPGRYVLMSGLPQHAIGNDYAVVQVTGKATGPQGESGGESALNGDQLVDERCTSCHSRERIDSADKSRDEWAETVDRMIGYGAQLNDDEREAVIEYLAETH